jgi:hypothetical protein
MRKSCQAAFLSQSKSWISWHNFYGYIQRNQLKKNKTKGRTASLQSFQHQFEVIVLAPLNNSVLTREPIIYAGWNRTWLAHRYWCILKAGVWRILSRLLPLPLRARLPVCTCNCYHHYAQQRSLDSHGLLHVVDCPCISVCSSWCSLCTLYLVLCVPVQTLFLFCLMSFSYQTFSPCTSIGTSSQAYKHPCQYILQTPASPALSLKYPQPLDAGKSHPKLNLLIRGPVTACLKQSTTLEICQHPRKLLPSFYDEHRWFYIKFRESGGETLTHMYCQFLVGLAVHWVYKTLGTPSHSHSIAPLLPSEHPCRGNVSKASHRDTGPCWFQCFWSSWLDVLWVMDHSWYTQETIGTYYHTSFKGNSILNLLSCPFTLWTAHIHNPCINCIFFFFGITVVHK